MTEVQKTLLALVKSALLDEPCPLPGGADLSAAMEAARHHGIAVMVYYGALLCGADPGCEVMAQTFSYVCGSIAVSEGQMAQVRRITDAFDGAGIEYMPLKGVRQKPLYPKPEMRAMGDADILIRTEQYPRIREIMLSLGYAEGGESDHELPWHKAPLHVELHKRLIPSYNKDYYAYFGDGWERARPAAGGGCRFEMTVEDEWIYLFTHFAKHYRDAGIGLRHPVDLWVFRHHHPDIDVAYVERELDKLRLTEFYRNVMDTLASWFEGKAATEKTEFITSVIFQSDPFGDRDNVHISYALKGTKSQRSVWAVRLRRLFTSVFVPYGIMCKEYPVLKKAPVLLPGAWVVYFFARLLQKNRVKNHIHALRLMSEDRVSEYQRRLNYVGLDYYGADADEDKT